MPLQYHQGSGFASEYGYLVHILTEWGNCNISGNVEARAADNGYVLDVRMRLAI